jgi:hypothetical protein
MEKKRKGVGLRPAPKQISVVELSISFIFQRNIKMCVCARPLSSREQQGV